MLEPQRLETKTTETTGEKVVDSPRTLSAQELFAGAREICIEHEGERYVLRITRRGKLILQK